MTFLLRISWFVRAVERQKVTLLHEDSGTCQKIGAPFSSGARRAECTFVRTPVAWTRVAYTHTYTPSCVHILTSLTVYMCIRVPDLTKSGQMSILDVAQVGKRRNSRVYTHFTYVHLPIGYSSTFSFSFSLCQTARDYQYVTGGIVPLFHSDFSYHLRYARICMCSK